MITRKLLIAFCSCLLIANVSRAEPTVTCVLLDGTRIDVQSLSITGDRVTGTGAPTDLTLDDLQRIEVSNADDTPDTKATTLAELRGSGHLWARQISITDEKAHIEWSGGQPLVVPVDSLRSLLLDIETDRAEFDKSLATPSAELDRLFLKNDRDQLDSIPGLIESLDAEQLKIDVSGQIRTIPRGRIHGIIFAQPVAAKTEPRCLVKFLDGSRLGGDKLSLGSGKATLSQGPNIDAQFAWSSVENVTIRSSHLAYLSDLTPVKEEHSPLVTLPFPARRDQSVSGRALRIGKEAFDKGLGVHARSALTFATDGKWNLFAAQIGLDAEAHGKGDCVFQVLADGKSIFERRVNNKDASPIELKLPIIGCRELTLLVEPGANLDLADHANWCEARLIKNK